jgi:hypothetical protein
MPLRPHTTHPKMSEAEWQKAHREPVNQWMTEVPFRFMWALRVLVKKAEEPRILWKGNARKARREVELIRYEKIVKIRKMLDDLSTIGWEKTCEKWDIDLSAKAGSLETYE